MVDRSGSIFSGELCLTSGDSGCEDEDSRRARHAKDDETVGKRAAVLSAVEARCFTRDANMTSKA